MTVDDWFLPAVRSSGNVEESLSEVAKREEARLLFVQALRQSLSCSYPGYTDAITELRSQVEKIDKTLEFRLGILEKSRDQAWFRESSAAELGPFAPKVNFCPIFPKFEPEKARRVRNELVEVWGQRRLEGELLAGKGFLWSQLFQLNYQWDQICVLKEPYQDLRLDELPEALPDDLASPSLIAYLGKVKEFVGKARSELDQSFQSLFSVSETFLLKFYQAPSNQERQTPQRPRPKRQGAIGDSLRYMKFAQTPDVKQLKKRYFELAKECHPDSPVGSDERFRVLRFHYERILREVQTKTAPR